MAILSLSYGPYNNLEAVDSVMHYLTSDHFATKRYLVACGSADLPEDVELAIMQVEAVQETFRTNDNIGKRAQHLVLLFDSDETIAIEMAPSKILYFLGKMYCHYIHSQGYQSYFGGFKAECGYELHFMINPVSFLTGKKLVLSSGDLDVQSVLLTGYFDLVSEEK